MPKLSKEIPGDLIANFVLDSEITPDQLTMMASLTPDDMMYRVRKDELVGIQEFIESPEYMKAKNIIYPKVLKELIAMNSGEFIEIVLTGGIGTAKTTCALYTQAYQLYLLLMMESPHDVFDLDPSSEILIVFQSLNKQLAMDVDYGRFRAMLDKAPIFKQRGFEYDRSRESEMRFANRIICKPLSGMETAAIGQNVIGGMLDELNYMAIIEKSKVSRDGGTYDQAIALYNSITRRRKSRFISKGQLPGILCLVSSKRYPGQFTDQKEEEAAKELKETGKTSIYCYDKRSWEVLPDGKYLGIWFNVFVGDLNHQPRVMDDDEKVGAADRHLVMKVPIEYKEDFEKDIMEALREIGGVSTLAHHPFMLNAEAVSAGFGSHRSILSRTEVDFKTTQLMIYEKRFIRNNEPRWIHVDLGLTGDSAGVACGFVEEFVEIKRGTDIEHLPVIYFDFTLRVRPPKGGEIEFSKIRALIYKLREMGLNIKWVSYDSWQSVESMQALRRKGYITGDLSVDVTAIPYTMLKGAFYDYRVRAPKDEHALKEILSLEFDVEKSKVDHPVNGSKDVGDGMAGVVHGLTSRRDIWARFGIPMHMIPEEVKTMTVKTKEGI